MTVRQFLLVFAIAAALQAMVFAWRYNDLLYLRRPLTAIESDSPDAFSRRAAVALARRRLTYRNVETIAEAAKAFHLSSLEVQALERHVTADPSDLQSRLRLADAYHGMGNDSRAERIYLEILQLTRSEAR